jgi:polyhydroxybutyrate depolymerase
MCNDSGVDFRHIDIGRQRRQYLLAEPPGQPTRLILCLHGSRSSATSQARLSRMGTVAVADGALVAFPQAVQPAGRGYEWNFDADTAYLSGLVDDLCGRYSIGSGQVCISGMSGGARMSSHFASIRPDAVSLVGAVAGMRAPSTSQPATRMSSRPVRILAFHGTADRINPYAGSGTARWNESVPDAAQQWAAANGADPNPTVEQLSTHVTRTTYGLDGAANGVVLWTVSGGGHTWPGTRLGPLLRLILGHTTTEIDATALIVNDGRQRLPA